MDADTEEVTETSKMSKNDSEKPVTELKPRSVLLSPPIVFVDTWWFADIMVSWVWAFFFFLLRLLDMFIRNSHGWGWLLYILLFYNSSNGNHNCVTEKCGVKHQCLFELNVTEFEQVGQCQVSPCFIPSGVVAPEAVVEGGVWVEVVCVVDGAWWNSLVHQDPRGVEWRMEPWMDSGPWGIFWCLTLAQRWYFLIEFG